ncbi:hypothetical protein [Desulfonema ishimotonii]|nr:hypothetical protein [Desulfonema ishimotonii]
MYSSSRGKGTDRHPFSVHLTTALADPVRPYSAASGPICLPVINS